MASPMSAWLWSRRPVIVSYSGKSAARAHDVELCPRDVMFRKFAHLLLRRS
jgi:hypothetical protein